MSTENAFRYRDLLTLLGRDKSWVDTYIKELKLQASILELRTQIAEISRKQGTTKQVIIERMKDRIIQIDKTLMGLASSTINKMLRGDSMAGRPSSETARDLLLERTMIESYRLPYIQSLNCVEFDATAKRIGKEIQDRTESIAGLEDKIAKLSCNGRHPYSISTGKPDKSIDGFELYADNLYELWQSCNETDRGLIAYEDKQLLKVKFSVKF